jgi:hypothetical protein
MFAEEAGGGPNGGRVYELIDPLNTTGVTLDRATGTFSGGTGAGNLVARPALGRNSFEGFAVYASGVTFFGDENRPAGGVAGGAYFKFIPASLRDPGAGPVTSPSTSRPTPPPAGSSACASAAATSGRAPSSARAPGSRSPPRLTPTSVRRPWRCT